MKTLPDDAQTNDLPTDFTAFLAQRLQLTPEAAEAKLGGWLTHYVPLKLRQSRKPREQSSSLHPQSVISTGHGERRSAA